MYKVACHQNARELFGSRYETECVWGHRFMSWMMVGQWLLGILYAVFCAPYTWIGQLHDLHIQVWLAIVLGSFLSGIAIAWMKLWPHQSITRHVVAITQVLWSTLLIHLSGGQSAAHFHLFISLAILAMYRDWRILVTAAVTTAIDHFVHGALYPDSVFGVVAESPSQRLEHIAWITCQVALMVPGCIRSQNQLRELSVYQSEIDEVKRKFDNQVKARTRELRIENKLLKDQLTTKPICNEP